MLTGQRQGERCVILANGPSLAEVDFERLEGETLIGMNRIYLLDLPIPLSYYVAINELVLRQFWKDIQRLPVPKFLNWNCRHLFSGSNTYFLRLRMGIRDRFAENLNQPLSSGGTVTFVALQIAFVLGFEEVILLGLDHHYPEQGTPNVTALRQGEDVSHFHPDYFPAGTKWQYPDLLRAEMAYQLARQVYEAHGRRIIDATSGGRCPVFEKVDFEDLF
ncbi:hypothetical protein D6779_00965 [Candidatus Parcubacteria bacterium]|nr:MAG: hypothetical protein D6779_00965 [Candidatus Parcubacteria bacterium]